MNAIDAFAIEVDTRLKRGQQGPDWDHESIQSYMREYCGRKAQFDSEARYLVASIILPRLDVVAAQFPNASTTAAPEGTSCRANLGYSQRYPVSTRIEFCVEHDVTWSWLHVRYELYMMPVFVKISPGDLLTLPLEGVMQRSGTETSGARFEPIPAVDHAVANWVEKCLLAFLDNYQQIDRGDPSFADDVATDPVCGMRLNRKQATAHVHRGHQYFFCSPECVKAFEEDPKKFVDFKMM